MSELAHVLPIGSYILDKGSRAGKHDYDIMPTDLWRRICGQLMANDGIMRRYAKSLEFIQAGFIACLQNARDLVAASKILMDSGYHAPALSLSVLALEEIGKVIAIDGLLFTRPDSDRAAKSTKA